MLAPDPGLTAPPLAGSRLERAWRRLATGVCFVCFGLLGLGFGVALCPLVTLAVRDPKRRLRIAQRWMGRAMALFLWLMAALRVLTYRIDGAAGLRHPGCMVVANHPSLIDVVFLMAAGGGMTCVAKDALFHHPVLGLAVRALGFVRNDSTLQMIDDCVGALRAGERVLAFPEGSRTIAGSQPVLQRGAAAIAVRAGCPVVPVVIRVSQPTLAKGMRWYDVPPRRPHFSVIVHPAIETRALVEAHATPMVAARRLNQRLQRLYSEASSGSA